MSKQNDNSGYIRFFLIIITIILLFGCVERCSSQNADTNILIQIITEENILNNFKNYQCPIIEEFVNEDIKFVKDIVGFIEFHYTYPVQESNMWLWTSNKRPKHLPNLRFYILRAARFNEFKYMR